MSKVGLWSTTAANNNSTPPDGWPEGQAPSTVNDCAREMMAQIRTLFNDPQFVDQGLVPTRITTTTFSVPGDQTTIVHAGRRLKLFDATAGVATTIYATVVTSSFTVVTTISLTLDAGNLTSSLSSFAVAALAANSVSLPRTPVIAKVWGAFSGIGVVTLMNSFGVVSITDVGVGSYAINFATAFSGSAYTAVVFADNDAVTPMFAQHNAGVGGRTPVSWSVLSQAAGGTATDCSRMNFCFYEL